MTGGRGPDVVIDAVGMEAHGTDLMAWMDRAKQAVRMEVIGVYGGLVDKFPMGAFFAKALTMRAGQCDVQKYLPRMLEHIRNGDIDTTSLISHELPLDDAPRAYEMFCNKDDGCTKVVLHP